jgi:Xaa-Pro aminopeptidase
VTTALERPTIPAARYGERLERARAALQEHGVGALLIGIGADLRYLTGYVATPLERLTMLVLPAAGATKLVAPRLEAMAAAACPAATAGLVDIVAWDETDDAYRLVAEQVRATAAGGPGGGASDRLLVDEGLWAKHVLALQQVMPERLLGLATEVTRELRMTKDADEIALLRLAAHAADRALVAVATGPLLGRTEIEVSREIGDRLVA